MYDRQNDIHKRTEGRWADILAGVGIPLQALKGKHTACPLCGGNDRFRFDDRQGRGTWICNQCGAGSGVDMVMKYLNMDFLSAKTEIERHIPAAQARVKKAVRGPETTPDRIEKVWAKGTPITEHDPAGKYLLSRGVYQPKIPSLRFVANAFYRHDDGHTSDHPAILARFVSPDAKVATLHTTYLTYDGCKANLPIVRRFAACPRPAHGSVRLDYSSEVLGVSTGLETSRSASILFGVPVWATLCDGALNDWTPPDHVKSVMVFGDNDANFSGQLAAYGLARRLTSLGIKVDVKIPERVGTDYNDVLREIGF